MYPFSWHWDLVLLQLGGDFLPDASVTAENDVLFHALQSLLEAELPQLSEVSRFRQSQHALNDQLDHDHATDHNQNGDEPSFWRQGLHLAVADGAHRD